MLQIPIDDQGYHVGELSETERHWGDTTYRRVAARYEALPSFVLETLRPLSLSKKQTTSLLTDFILAFSHALKTTFPPKDEKQLDARLKKMIFTFLPCITENLQTLRTSHLVQYEPIALSNIYVSNVLYQDITLKPLHEEDEFVQYFSLELIGFFRAIRSLMLLLTIGDDAHAMALLRGALECVSKITLAEKFSEEYVLFKKYNLYLQDLKHNKTPLPTEMTEYLKNKKEYSKSRESFLAYGWAKNKKGKRLLSLNELLREGIGSDPGIFLLYQTSSEFVHEDYVGVGYDYISIRKHLVDFCFWLYTVLLEEGLPSNFLSKDALQKALHLLRLARPYYRGEFPLPLQ